jgi:hypothetical protein
MEMIKFDASVAKNAAAIIGNLERQRGTFVVQYRDHPGSWPDGPGAWFRDEDWDASGKLVATGEARLRAIDWYANDRAAGRPCPPLGGVTTKAPKSALTPSPVNAPVIPDGEESTPVNAPGVNAKPARADMATYMRERRAAAKAAKGAA